VTKPLKVQVIGPLSPYVNGFSEELATQGYSPLSAANLVRVMAHLSRWMQAEGIATDELSRQQTLEFLRIRNELGYVCWTTERGLRPMLSFLRSIGTVPEIAPPTIEGPIEELVDAYCTYLISERGLVATTVRRCVKTARWFLATCEGVDTTPVQTLTALHVRAFVLQECSSRKVGSAQLLVSELRCLMRFLFVSGRIAEDLSTVIPAVAGQRGNSLPKGLDRSVVIKVLASCDRRTNTGKRDFAILTLLSRLGLRSGEVTGLSLDDVDWRAGEITIVGKGNRKERVPLPVDVGETLVAYLRRRPKSEHRNVFLRAQAPYVSITPSAINYVVRYACIRAGIPVFGPHRLRHSLATDMLRAGATLVEVGQVLRHRSVETTAIYAKVDDAALRSLALPWPGSAQ
jgi:integrase/recombinase XerD